MEPFFIAHYGWSQSRLLNFSLFFSVYTLLFVVLVAGLKALVKFAKMLAVGLILLGLFYGVELLLGVAAVASMHERCFLAAVVTCIYGYSS